MSEGIYLSAEEAATELNISKASLYAYVSRGLIRSEEGAAGRKRRYRAEDVRALRTKKERQRDGEAPAKTALDWGAPVLDSAITYIGPEGLYYRGRDACALAATASLESVATLLWDIDALNPFSAPIPAAATEAYGNVFEHLRPLRPLERCQALLPFIAASDPGAVATRGPGAANTAALILRAVSAALAGVPLTDRPIAKVFADGWGLDSTGRHLLRSAMILCADHELNVSTFTVRCAVSAGTTLYAGIGAGLAALQGHRHGGMSEAACVFIDTALEEDDMEGFVRGRLRRGEGLPGFAHRLYPQGDPRAAMLLALMESQFGESDTFQRAMNLRDIAQTATGHYPSLDFTNGLLARLLDLPEEAALAFFAAGRCTGWLAHALEQVNSNTLIRPRARYTGLRTSQDRSGSRATP